MQSFQKIAVFLVVWGSFAAPALGSATVENFLNLAQAVVAQQGTGGGGSSTSFQTLSQIAALFPQGGITTVSYTIPSTAEDSSVFEVDINIGGAAGIEYIFGENTENPDEPAAANIAPTLNKLNATQLQAGVQYLLIAVDAYGNPITEQTELSSAENLCFYMFDSNGKVLDTASVLVSEGNLFDSDTDASTILDALPLQVTMDVNQVAAGSGTYPVVLKVMCPSPVVPQDKKAVVAYLNSLGITVNPWSHTTQINFSSTEKKPYPYVNFNLGGDNGYGFAIDEVPPYWFTAYATENPDMEPCVHIGSTLKSVKPAEWELGINMLLVAEDKNGTPVTELATATPDHVLLYVFDSNGAPLLNKPKNIPWSKAINLGGSLTVDEVGIGVNGNSVTGSNPPTYPVMFNLKWTSAPMVQNKCSLIKNLENNGATVAQVPYAIDEDTEFSSWNVDLSGGQGLGYAFGKEVPGFWQNPSNITKQGTLIPVPVLSKITQQQWKDGISLLLVGMSTTTQPDYKDSIQYIITDFQTTAPQQLALYVLDSKGFNMKGSPIYVPTNAAYLLNSNASLTTSFTTQSPLLVGIGINDNNITNNMSGTPIYYPAMLNLRWTATHAKTKAPLITALESAGAKINQAVHVIHGNNGLSSANINLSGGEGLGYAIGGVPQFWQNSSNITQAGTLIPAPVLSTITQQQWKDGISLLLVGMDTNTKHGYANSIKHIITDFQTKTPKQLALYVLDFNGNNLTGSPIYVPLSYAYLLSSNASIPASFTGQSPLLVGIGVNGNNITNNMSGQPLTYPAVLNLRWPDAPATA